MNDEYIMPYKFEYIYKINIKDGIAGLRVCVFIILNDLVEESLIEAIWGYSPPAM